MLQARDKKNHNPIYITYETAILASEKGFNQGCTYFYNAHGECDTRVSFAMTGDTPVARCPTQSILQAWLRDYYKLAVTVEVCAGMYEVSINNIDNYHTDWIYDGDEVKDFKTYEEALEEGLQFALNLIKFAETNTKSE